MRTRTLGGAAVLAAVSVLTACAAGSHRTTGAARPATTGASATTAPAVSLAGGSGVAASASSAPAQRPTTAARASTGTPPTQAGSPAGATTAAPAAPDGPTSAPSASGGAGGIGSAAPVLAPACELSALRVQALRGGASMGHEYALIMFTNDAATACRVSGYPSVSLRHAGATLGSAQPAQTSGSGSVMLRSGATAQVQVRVGTECAAAQSDAVRVGVPQSDGYVTVPLTLRGCTLRVGAFQPAG